MRRPLYIRQIGRRRYAVDGTPTDCVLLAVHQVIRDRPPDLVLSGVNRGGNLGEDATYSGTIAAAMEGTLLGIPSIAFSQRYGDDKSVLWATTEAWIAPVLERLVATSWPDGVLLNVNFPDVAPADVTGIEVTRQGRHKVGGAMKEGVDPRGVRYYWIGGERDEDTSLEGTDLEAVHRGAISVTPMSLDLTDEPALGVLRTALHER
jgi:5'-nucleotidase